MLEREAGHLNQTTEVELAAANQTRLLGEVAFMLETIRAVNLTAANAAANQELRCVGVCARRNVHVLFNCNVNNIYLSLQPC